MESKYKEGQTVYKVVDFGDSPKYVAEMVVISVYKRNGFRYRFDIGLNVPSTPEERLYPEKKEALKKAIELNGQLSARLSNQKHLVDNQIINLRKEL